MTVYERGKNWFIQAAYVELASRYEASLLTEGAKVDVN